MSEETRELTQPRLMFNVDVESGLDGAVLWRVISAHMDNGLSLEFYAFTVKRTTGFPDLPPYLVQISSNVDVAHGYRDSRIFVDPRDGSAIQLSRHNKGVSELYCEVIHPHKSWDGKKSDYVKDFECEIRRTTPNSLADPDKSTRWIDFVYVDDAVKIEPRRIKCQEWNRISSNYGSATKAAVDRMVALNQPQSNGRLILLHGSPGTGKSHAIRMLVKEWKKWAYFRYIVDPEKLLRNPKYLMQMIDRDPDNVDGDSDEDDGIPKWPVLVLEDAGNYIARDASEASGLDFGRLLNAADGLIGDGFNCLIIITTNERMDLHRAISRPGRCLADIEFTKLSASESTEWIKNNGGSGLVVDKPSTIAELYSMIGPGLISNATNDTVGFTKG